MSADGLFLGTDRGDAAYRAAMEQATDAVLCAVAAREEPYSGASPDALAEYLDDPVVPEEGRGLEATLDEVAERVLAHSVDPSNPRCGAHLQCPPMVPGLAAEVLLSATNQSLDSFDQAPAATLLEERVVGALCDLFGLPAGADGVFTSGGTQSNFQALLLARDQYCARQFDRDVQAEGLPPEADSLRLLCSAEAHFTTNQSAHHLGLGEDAVVTVPADGDRRMDPGALEATLAALRKRGAVPFALVGTAGTTDFGSIDPLGALADAAAEHGLWFHVDAAYGGALAVSDEYGDLLAGIERADSVAVDFHKLFYQPISCGALLVRDGDEFRWMARNAAYLNPEAHDDRGVPNLVSKSVQTTRRFDALKPYVAFRALGRSGMAALVERTLELADEAASLLESADDFELLGEPTLNAVVFRYRPCEGMTDEAASRLNADVRRELLADGRAVVARTEVDDATCLKLTLLNPTATLKDVGAILEAVRECGSAVADPGEVIA
ncbi:pyridoxal phosphate-dependent decarboxylase family protein [Halalkalicoccus jeotgali]|uniref:Pyridoxal-dependent decarboxylase n=1 Tax=Halalkalicoccus jeotgali (strain DSM 18796 / CECT 7217 / JCM 14584 / KCTC 4019 / B3) TaxID=795797 RepID=D8JB87_HALJB|nr:aspartate aminotransferase family protein [Halalkalicoccus jeotgali]ADJ16540.1 Pyridoxal-dependent decarboxylase [Halalkalicoccus jeotgali B3]ELY41365.1 pyridoxal-dependent decarboxylase [Halalkalicoccus jeotgali B3]